MPVLAISNFSCIRESTLQVAPVNVIIGPQGSGKSVTTKLLYFFTDILNTVSVSAERGVGLEEFKKGIAKQFAIWFPPPAWGAGRFNINYSSGPFSARILRRRKNGVPSDEVSVTFSDWFADFYSETLQNYENLSDNNLSDDEAVITVRQELDRAYRLRDVTVNKLTRALGQEYMAEQTFIPAGRAFFTSIGRLVAGFEQSGSLDPVTLKFARLFASLRDRASRQSSGALGRLGAEFLERRNRFMSELFGGEVKFERDQEFVETSDGRKVPFSALSSGQQELLPMWSLLDYFNEVDARRSLGGIRLNRRRELIYIEEPEAHLFPSAQSLLMEFLIGSVASERSRRNLIVTTHSPYIMSKLNVFLKAGQLSRRKKRNTEINEIVPRECWLSDKQISAVAIVDGELVDLIDSDGLIDSAYLDGISETISNEFSELLQIESEI